MGHVGCVRPPSHAGTQARTARPAHRALPHWGNLFPIKRIRQHSLLWLVGRAALPAPTSLISTTSEARLGKASASIPPCQGCKRSGAEPQPEPVEELPPSAGWGPGPIRPRVGSDVHPRPPRPPAPGLSPRGCARARAKSPDPPPRVVPAVRGVKEGCSYHPLPLHARALRRAPTAFSLPLKIGFMVERQRRRAGSPDPKPACVAVTN